MIKRLTLHSGSRRCFSSLQERFSRSVESLKTLQEEPSSETKLKMYGLYKQATQGPCNKPAAGMFDLVGRAKHDAWTKLGDMPKEESMVAYIDVVAALKGPDAGEDSGCDAASGEDSSTPHMHRNVTLKSVAFPRGANRLSSLKLETIRASVSPEGVGSVVLSRPTRGNALNVTMWQELKHVFEVAGEDLHVRAVILTGAGDNFCTGMDLGVFSELLGIMESEPCDGRQREGMGRLIQFLQDAVSAAERCPVPVIAAVHGPCIGGAVDIITACDIRYCTADSKFCIKETQLAMVG